MRLLLFFVSFLFSFIFYNFYLLTKGKNILGENTFYSLNTHIITGNLIIESIFFLVIGIFFVIYFTSYELKKNLVDYNKIIYILFYILLLFPFYFGVFELNNTIFIFLVMFIFGDITFTYISNIKYFINEKIKLRYFGLILNYLVFISSVLYLFIINHSYYIFFIVIYSIIFNFNIHKNFGNYISLCLSILGSIFIIYYLFLKIYEFYIVLF